jgi:hypothetical protein
MSWVTMNPPEPGGAAMSTEVAIMKEARIYLD